MKIANKNKISEEQLVNLKKRYDEDFVCYWTAGSKPPKFRPISMDEFKNRLKNTDFLKNLVDPNNFKLVAILIYFKSHRSHI